jgi:hypothetical protein
MIDLAYTTLIKPFLVILSAAQDLDASVATLPQNDKLAKKKLSDSSRLGNSSSK